MPFTISDSTLLIPGKVTKSHHKSFRFSIVTCGLKHDSYLIRRETYAEESPRNNKTHPASYTVSRNIPQSSTHPKRSRLDTGGRFHLVHTHTHTHTHTHSILCVRPCSLRWRFLGVKTDKISPRKTRSRSHSIVTFRVTPTDHARGPASTDLSVWLPRPGSGSLLIITRPSLGSQFPPQTAHQVPLP